jgi:CheY-like chemotaxis protein
MITIQAGYALVIDDEPANRDFLERLLQTASFKVTGAGTGAEGLRAAQTFPELALALVDQELPDATGLEIIAALRAKYPESLLVMATMHDDRALIDEAFLAGIDVFLVKPHGFMELYRRLQEVDSDTSLLRRLVIDQYGPRPYRGVDGRSSSEVPATRPDEEVTRPSTPATATAVAEVLDAPAAPAVAAPAVASPSPAAPVVPVTAAAPASDKDKDATVPAIHEAPPAVGTPDKPVTTTPNIAGSVTGTGGLPQPPQQHLSSSNDATIVRRPKDFNINQ